MKVKAIKRGFFGGQLREPNAKNSEFECTEKEFSESWMEEIEGKKTESKPKPKAKAKAKKKKKLSHEIEQPKLELPE